ncbi:MAG: class I SAM-dependent methyltransferase [Desulfobacter sp.]|nr:class I SAM-dependent methyltransferase [Desulfobacter sp.]WDP85313.1 MAG: class I SAM-dependent methyltransferase [Desulfobacter sp.]
MTAFSDKLVEILNHGSLNLALGMGYALKIFDLMDGAQKALTLDELAKISGLHSRYLKEWLSIMVCGEIVELEKKQGEQLFSLPKAHGDLLCRRAGNNNLGVYTQEIPLLTAIAMDEVQQDFAVGKGVPFSKYPRFQSFMAELSNAKHGQVLIKDFLPSVDQGRLVKNLESGIRACDIGCGQGVALNLMAQAFPNSEFVGIDNHDRAIDQAKKSANALGISNASFILQDAATVHQNKSLEHYFDYICAFDAVHDQSHPLQVLAGIRYMLKPEGRFSMIDIKAQSEIQENKDHPMAPFLYTVSLMHCMPIGLNDKGQGLGMMWGRQKAMDLLTRAGFSRVTQEEIPNDPFNLHFLCRV